MAWVPALDDMAWKRASTGRGSMPPQITSFEPHARQPDSFRKPRQGDLILFSQISSIRNEGRHEAGVSSSGYYAWIKRRPSQRAETDTMLIAEIRVAHEASRGTYGAPRIHAELAAKGLRVGRKRIARFMARAGLAGVRRRSFATTTVRNGGR